MSCWRIFFGRVYSCSDKKVTPPVTIYPHVIATSFLVAFI